MLPCLISRNSIPWRNPPKSAYANALDTFRPVLVIMAGTGGFNVQESV